MKDDQHGGELDDRPIEDKEVYVASGKTEVVDTGKELDLIKTIDVGSQEDNFNVTAAQEETRAKIALFFTQVFLTLVILSLVAPFLLNALDPQNFTSPLASAKELVTVVASVLAGPFGFIVGFYFKSRED